MTYSIIARDTETGYMGVATQSQAFAVGSSVPWAAAGAGVVATQSMGEPMYGDLGLSTLGAGLTAAEALEALCSVDPHPERRQVGIVDAQGGIAVYTGDACVAAAGHLVGDSCVALANIVQGPRVWEGMVEAYESSAGWLPFRLMAALRAAEAAGGDERGRRSAAVLVVRAERSGRPWRDTITDLRVDDRSDPVDAIDQMVEHNWRYQQTVTAFEDALDDEVDAAIKRLPPYPEGEPLDPDLMLWRAIVLGTAGRKDEARRFGDKLVRQAPHMVRVARRFGDVGLVDPELLADVFPA